jgi:hypothetical protein
MSTVLGQIVDWIEQPGHERSRPKRVPWLPVYGMM